MQYFNAPTFVKPSTWIPPDHKITSDTLATIQTIVHSTESVLNNYENNHNRLFINHTTNNLTKEERRALRQLTLDRRIIIKPADKGSCTVVMDRSAYIREAERQLNNPIYYKKLTHPIYMHTTPLINSILLDMLNDNIISHKQYNFLKADIKDRPRQFYILPKIHKTRHSWPYPNMPEGRPIISDCGSESYRIAKYINSFIRPISMQHPAFIRDTYDFIDKIKNIKIPTNSFLVTGDVTALYTNMAFDRVMEEVKKAFTLHPLPRRPDDYLLKLLDLTMRRNDFQFNGKTYLQVCGMAMGKTYAPALADLYMTYFDEKAHELSTLLDTYYRFLDDIFFIWIGSEDTLISFQERLNTIIPGIKITLNWSRESVNFLDTTIYRYSTQDHHHTLRTRVYFKDTDTHQLLHKNSFHPNHTYKGVLKSQLIRFKRISSTKEDYDHTCHILFRALSKRQYCRSLMRKMKRDTWATPLHIIRNTSSNTDSILPIVVPYNKLGTRLSTLWRNAITENTIFSSSKLITAYTTAPNLRHHLVRATINPHLTTHVTPNESTLPVSNQCSTCDHPRCRTCPHISVGTTFSSSINSRVFTVKGQISCKTTNLIYLITCTACRQQYVGETGRKLTDRLCDHRSAILLRKNTPIAHHFNLPNHSINNLKIMGIHGFPTETPFSKRRIYEINYQNLLETAFPNGINNLNNKLASTINPVSNPNSKVNV